MATVGVIHPCRSEAGILGWVAVTIVAYERDHVPVRYLRRYGTHFGLDHYLETNEMSADEINRIRREVDRGYNRMVLATGRRRPR